MRTCMVSCGFVPSVAALCGAAACLLSCGGSAPASPGPVPVRPSDSDRPDALGAPEPQPPVEVPASPPAGDVAALARSAVRDLCSDPLRAKVRRALGEDVPFCGSGVYDLFVRVRHEGHEVIVVGYRDETPSYADGPVIYGGWVMFDGALLPDGSPSDEPFWKRLGDLSGLAPEEAQAVLQGVLLASGVFSQFTTLDDLREEIGGWADALALVESQPPGLRSDERGHFLRVWSYHHQAERGAQCSHLSKHEITLAADGTIDGPHQESWAEGTSLGAPCGTPPPPSGASGSP